MQRALPEQLLSWQHGPSWAMMQLSGQLGRGEVIARCPDTLRDDMSLFVNPSTQPRWLGCI